MKSTISFYAPIFFFSMFCSVTSLAITNGQVVSEQETPEVVYIKIPRGTYTGVAVGSGTILTAMHCVSGVQPADIKVNGAPSIAMFLAATLLMPAVVRAGTYSAFIQCQPQGPVFAGKVIVPDSLSDWTVTDLGNRKCERHANENVEIEFNGQKYIGPFAQFTYELYFPYKDGECQKEMNKNGFGTIQWGADLLNQTGLRGSISVRSIDGNHHQLSRPSSIYFEALDQSCSISY